MCYGYPSNRTTTYLLERRTECVCFSEVCSFCTENGMAAGVERVHVMCLSVKGLCL